jgi:DNA-binding transcriptional LysR family regulator
MITRHLQYLTALAKERHFARAAATCNVSQPTLSAGIKQLEESLGVLLVERGQRYVGLTPEGERALALAQRVLADYNALMQELSEMREGLVGRLRIGAIPVTLPIVSLLTTPFVERHARTTVIVTSQTSIDIQRGLDDFSLDIGLTYLDNEPLARVQTLPLYRERYVLLTHRESTLGAHERVSWSQAASQPMCLLTPDMQNRRILDMHFHEAAAEVHAVVETNSLITLWSHVRFGALSTVVPESFLLLVGNLDGLVAIPLIEPTAAHLVGIVASDHEPLAAVAKALLHLARTLDLQSVIEKRIQSGL